LLENGAHVNVPGDENETALHDAVACNKLEIVRLLIAKGADVHARNSRGLTPRCDASEDVIRKEETTIFHHF
jgi:ankyrin repeat protein